VGRVNLSKSALKRQRKKQASAALPAEHILEETTVSDFKSAEPETISENHVLNSDVVPPSTTHAQELTKLLVDDVLTFGGSTLENSPARKPIVKPLTPTANSIEFGGDTLSVASNDFTPFSGPSVVPVPVVDFTLSPKSSSPHQLRVDNIQPMRSMRSARVGIIGSSGSAKNNSDSAVTLNSELIPRSNHIPDADKNASQTSESVRLLNLLLETGKNSSNSSKREESYTQPPGLEKPKSSVADGYFKSKGGFSVRLS
jgi:hypothetical protein